MPCVSSCSQKSKHHLLRHSLPQEQRGQEALRHFGCQNTRQAVRKIHRMPQKELQASFERVYGVRSASNNNSWLRKKLIEAVTARKSKQLVERMAEATPRRKRRKPHPPSKTEEYLVAENSTAAEALMALLRENTRDPQKSISSEAKSDKICAEAPSNVPPSQGGASSFALSLGMDASLGPRRDSSAGRHINTEEFGRQQQWQEPSAKSSDQHIDQCRQPKQQQQPPQPRPRSKRTAAAAAVAAATAAVKHGGQVEDVHASNSDKEGDLPTASKRHSSLTHAPASMGASWGHHTPSIAHRGQHGHLTHHGALPAATDASLQTDRCRSDATHLMQQRQESSRTMKDGSEWGEVGVSRLMGSPSRQSTMQQQLSSGWNRGRHRDRRTAPSEGFVLPPPSSANRSSWVMPPHPFASGQGRFRGGTNSQGVGAQLLSSLPSQRSRGLPAVLEYGGQRAADDRCVPRAQPRLVYSTACLLTD